MITRRPTPWKLALGFLVAILSVSSVKADQIDRIMVQDSGGISKAVQGLKAQNVAVLPFQVKIGDAPPTFKAGSEGVEMLHRMENILILGLDSKTPAYNLLTKAGQTAATLSKTAKTPIDWTTAAGRQKLLEMKLPVIWNEKELHTPDAFVTGTVLVSKDYHEVKIELISFTKADPQIKKMATLVGSSEKGQTRGIRTDRSVLASLGQTFSTSRGLKATGRARDLIAGDDAAATDAAKRDETGTVAAPASPVKLDVVLDGQVSTPEPDGSSGGEVKVGVKIPPGTAGQKVTFRLENTSPEKLAVLLCLDGRNTIALDNESLDSPDKPRSKFRMYVLSPNVKYEIQGFLTNAETGAVNSILVGTDEESAALYDTMNAETRGKIQMFVYGKAPLPTPNITGAETKAADEEETKIDDAFGASNLTTSDRSLGKSGNVANAKARVLGHTKLNKTPEGKLAASRGQSRNLFIEQKEKSTSTGKTEVVQFGYDEQPLDSLVITYHTPK